MLSPESAACLYSDCDSLSTVIWIYLLLTYWKLYLQILIWHVCLSLLQHYFNSEVLLFQDYLDMFLKRIILNVIYSIKFWSFNDLGWC